MLRITKLLIMAMVACSLMAGGAYADDYGNTDESGEQRHGQMFEKMAKELDLTADQQAKLKANREAKKEKMRSLREAMKANREKIREAMKQPGATRESVQPIIAETKSLQAQMIDQRVDGIFEAKSILTPEQFEKMQKHIRDKMKDRKGREGRWKRGNM